MNLFAGQSIQVRLGAAGIAEVCFDRQGESINKFDVRTVGELGEATRALRASGDLRGVLVTSAKDVFIVGADIFEFVEVFERSEAQIAAHIAAQSAVFTAFEDLPLPIVAAVNGFALGGGLEMALTADARVLSDAARIGLPEVTLGIFPGYGGTVRLPRVSSLAVAIDWISGGKPQPPAAALAAGVVERVVPAAELRTSALGLLESLIASGEWRARRQRRHGPVAADPEAVSAARVALGRAAAWQPAPLRAVELMEQAAGIGRDAALVLESEAFGRIARTQAAASLVQLFINDQQLKKKGKAYLKAARKVSRAAVVGAGIMGGGVAYTSAARGVPVQFKDISAKALETGLAEARKLFAKQVDSGRLTSAAAAAAYESIRVVDDYAAFGEVDLVVEAVVEKIDVKKAVLADIERALAPTAIVASNTSSLSITEMAKVLARPQNVVGMHFFNPVHAMPLVEVIRGAQTSDEAVATTAGYALALGKTPIVVRECPGFLVNRILIPYMLGFLMAIRDGADYRELDQALEAFGWPMGPAYLNDVIGHDTMKYVIKVITDGFSPRMQTGVPSAIERLVDAGRLGQKNGAGFYRYELDPRGRPKKSVDPATEPLLAALQPAGRKAFGAAELTERLMLPMVIEAARCLEEGIAEGPVEVDMSLILGLGFPRHAGGPLKYADWLGLRHVVERCDHYRPLGELYAATDGMRSMARDGRRYHGATRG